MIFKINNKEYTLDEIREMINEMTDKELWFFLADIRLDGYCEGSDEGYHQGMNDAY